ncbi:hypothetical protein MHYP_G00077970 [Metynnis hypsauchen]
MGLPLVLIAAWAISPWEQELTYVLCAGPRRAKTHRRHAAHSDQISQAKEPLSLHIIPTCLQDVFLRADSALQFQGMGPITLSLSKWCRFHGSKIFAPLLVNTLETKQQREDLQQ